MVTNLKLNVSEIFKLLTTYKLCDYQKSILELIDRQQHILISKPRDMHITDLYMSYIFDKCITNGNITSMIMSSSKNTNYYIRDKFKDLTDMYGIKCDVLNTNRLEFNNNVISILNTNVQSSCSSMVNHLCIIDADLIPNLDEVLMGVIPCVVNTGTIFISGNDNNTSYFKKLYDDTNNYIKLRISF